MNNKAGLEIAICVTNPASGIPGPNKILIAAFSNRDCLQDQDLNEALLLHEVDGLMHIGGSWMLSFLQVVSVSVFGTWSLLLKSDQAGLA